MTTKLRWARLGLAGLIALTVAGAMVTSRPSAALAQVGTTPPPTCPPGQAWNPLMNRCWPIKPPPCPAGTIDIQDNGQNDGGDDCQPLRQMPSVVAPVRCGPGALGPDGGAACDTSLGLQVDVGVGCVDVRRSPYPRAMVANDLKLSDVGVLPSVDGVGAGQPGWYRLTANPMTTEGLYLHERYGQVTHDSAGRPAFDTRSLLAGPYRYPSINNVRIVLRFERNSDAGSRWWLEGQMIASGPVGQELAVDGATHFDRASYPLPGADVQFNGPDLQGNNALPAFPLRLETSWSLVYYATWDTFGVNGHNEYVHTGSGQSRIGIGNYVSLRAWDSRQHMDSVIRGIYCNAADGYIPLPILEGQSVLIQ
jgi:hypothetical protein